MISPDHLTISRCTRGFALLAWGISGFTGARLEFSGPNVFGDARMSCCELCCPTHAKRVACVDASTWHRHGAPLETHLVLIPMNALTAVELEIQSFSATLCRCFRGASWEVVSYYAEDAWTASDDRANAVWRDVEARVRTAWEATEAVGRLRRPEDPDRNDPASPAPATPPPTRRC